MPLTTDSMTPEEFAIFSQAFQTNLMKAYIEAPAPLVEALALKVVLSGTDTAHFGNISQMPGMHPYDGNRKYRDWSSGAFTVKSEPHSSEIKARRQDVEYTREGVLTARMQQWVQVLKMYPYEMIIALINAGKTADCFDGKKFFANDHPDGVGGTNDNLLAGSGTSLANFKTDVAAVSAALRGYIPYARHADDARKQNTRLSHVLVSPGMEAVARETFLSPFVSAGVVNTYFGRIPEENIIVDANLTVTSANSWVGFGLPPHQDKPFVFQESRELGIKIFGPGSEHYEIHQEYLFIADQELEMAPLNPLCAVLVDQ